MQEILSKEQWDKFDLVEGDICNLETCSEITKGVNFVLHQAALGSVPRSIKDPIPTNEINISGFLNFGIPKIISALFSEPRTWFPRKKVRGSVS